MEKDKEIIQAITGLAFYTKIHSEMLMELSDHLMELDESILELIKLQEQILKIQIKKKS